MSLESALLRGKYTIEAWSGENNSIVNSPFFVNGANGDRTSQDVVPFIEWYSGAKVNLADNGRRKGDEVRPGDEGPRLCFAVHLTSYSPGLAVVKLAIREDLLGLLPGRDPELKHQFLAIFMTASAADADRRGRRRRPGRLRRVSPAGHRSEQEVEPGLREGRCQGHVPARLARPGLPVRSGDHTLPTDWETLARMWAVDDNPYAGGEYGSAPMRWDIHDDTSRRPGPAHEQRRAHPRCSLRLGRQLHRRLLAADVELERSRPRPVLA